MNSEHKLLHTLQYEYISRIRINIDVPLNYLSNTEESMLLS